MTLYSSGKHDHLTTDPTPWEVDDGGGLTAYGSREDAHHDGFTEVRWEPQPEFDRPLTNPANPILAGIREGKFTRREALDAFGDGFDQFAYPFSGAEIIHATRILTRLASVGMTEGTDHAS